MTLVIIRLNANGNDSGGGGGEIRFPNDATRSIEVLCDVRLVNAQALISVINPDATVQIHQFIVHGDIYQNNTSGDWLRFYTAANVDYIEPIFKGGNTQQVDVVSGNNPALYNIRVDKSVGTLANINTNFTLNVPSNGAVKPIILTKGSIALNNNAIDITINSGGIDFSIPANTILSIKDGTVRIGGAASTGIRLDGRISISGGNLIIGDNDGNDDHYIVYTGSGNASIDISACQLIVESQLRRDFLTPSGTIAYTQTGGTAILGRYEVPNNNRSTFEILNFNSSFTHTGGDLIVVRKQPSAGVAGFTFRPTTVNATAPIQIGNSNTPNSHSIDINASNSIGTLLISGDPTSLTANVITSPLTITTDLIVESGATLNTNGLDITIGGDMSITGTMNGSNTKFIFNTNSTNTATLNALTTFNEVVVDKSTGSITFAGSNNVNLPTQTEYWNLIIESAASRTRILSANDIIVNNNIEIRGNARLGSNNRTIRLSGNWINNSGNALSFDGEASSVEIFNGSADQSISGSAESTFRNVRFENGQMNNILLSNITVVGTMTIQNGRLNLNGYTVTISPGATLSETSSHYVSGSTGQIVTTRNLSASPRNVGGLGFNISFSAQAPGNTTISRRHQRQTGNGLNSIVRVYSVSPTVNSGMNAAVTFNYLDSELSGLDASRLASGVYLVRMVADGRMFVQKMTLIK